MNKHLTLQKSFPSVEFTHVDAKSQFLLFFLLFNRPSLILNYSLKGHNLSLWICHAPPWLLYIQISFFSIIVPSLDTGPAWFEGKCLPWLFPVRMQKTLEAPHAAFLSIGRLHNRGKPNCVKRNLCVLKLKLWPSRIMQDQKGDFSTS